jgi:hypothetical protein
VIWKFLVFSYHLLYILKLLSFVDYSFTDGESKLSQIVCELYYVSNLSPRVPNQSKIYNGCVL